MSTTKEKPADWGGMRAAAGPLFTAPDLDALLKEIAGAMAGAVDAEAACVLLLTEEGRSFCFRTARDEEGRILRRHIFPADQGLAGWVMTHREPLITDNAPADPRFDARLDDVDGRRPRTLLALPLWNGEELLGVCTLADKRDGASFGQEDLEALKPLAEMAAGMILRERRAEEHRNFFTHAMDILTAAVETARPDLRGRPARAARTAADLGRRLGLGAQACQDLRHAALLRGLGTLVGARCEAEEALTGAALMKDVRLLRGAAPIILHRLERWDGGGLPQGLKGEEIPLGARILALAEEVEAAATPEQAAEIARYGTGKIFDPLVVMAYLDERGSLPSAKP